MKSNLNKYVEEVIKGFQQNRGKASVYCFPPIDFAEVVFNVILQFYNRSPGCQVFVAVDSYNTRKAILARIEKHKATDPNIFNVKILSADYIKESYKYDYRLIITVGVNDNLKLLQLLNKDSKFMLSILTKNIMDTDFITNVRYILPNIETTVSENSIRTDNIYSPVEEYRLGIDLSEDDYTLYQKYNEYINTSISVFGELDNIQKCKYGDPKLNISSAEFRDSLAKENGWNNQLDTTVAWNKQIDDVYNPNVLYERAHNFFNITRQRRDLVTDNVAKLELIRALCSDNYKKKILIVSKRGEFAAEITKYMNTHGTLECGDYHDCINNAVLIDDASGLPVLIKSGKDKGTPKMIGSQAISTLNMKRFNTGSINVLSIKNSSNVKLQIAVDMVIFTSPFVDDIISFKTRYSDVVFRNQITTLYKVYCRGTIEANQLTKQKESPLITVIDDTDDSIGYSETNDSIII